MKSFFTALCFFNILNACVINFVDDIKNRDVTYGHMQIFSDIDKSQKYTGKPTDVSFLNNNFQFIGTSVACWRHCNKVKKHREYNVSKTDVVKKENLGEFEYDICVFGKTGRHEFDMHVFRNPISKNYEITIFKDILHNCIFVDVILKDSAECCTFPDNGLIEILQEYK